MEGVANFFFEAIQLQSISYQTIFGVAFYKVKRRRRKKTRRKKQRDIGYCRNEEI